MPSVPDDHQPHHDGAPPSPVPPPSTETAALALVERFGPQGWQIEHPYSDVWIAVRRQGSRTRVIAAHTPVGLYGKLQRIEVKEAGPSGPCLTDAAALYFAYLDQLGQIGTGQ